MAHDGAKLERTTLSWENGDIAVSQLMSAKSSSLVFLLALATPPVKGEEFGCFPPVRPFVPIDPRDAAVYSDLIRQDFELYIADFEDYLRCLDTERARVFAEGQAVSQEYGQFQRLTENLQGR